ncbi:MAG: M28 family peptidase [Thermoanaerobaculia bacterium]
MRGGGRAITLLILASASITFGADPPSSPETTARKLRQSALDDPTAYAIVSDLTTLFGPRPAGSSAEKRAAEWCAETMKSMHLANVHIEEFALTEWRRGEEHGEIVGIGAQRLVITALGGTPATEANGVEGEVVIFPTLDDLKSAADGSLRGRIAMLDYRMSRTESGLPYNVATRGRGEGPLEAAARGAIAFVLRSAGTGEHRLPHTGGTRFKDGRVPIPAFALAQQDADQIVRLAAKGAVRLRLSSTARLVAGQKSQNVIGEVPGSHPDEIITIGAHLDSWDLGTGAVDDGAGVGIVLATAKLLASMKPARTIRVVLFGAEEVTQPDAPFFIVGGNAYAQAHKDEIARYVIASEADLGAGRIIGLDLPQGWATSDFATVAARVLLPLGILVESEAAPHGGADNFPLQTLGVPVFLFKQDASRYFDLHHTADDTLDKIDPAELRQNVAAWTSMLWLVSESGANFRQP